MPTYVALIRGINVGGHKKVAMVYLRYPNGLGHSLPSNDYLERRLGTRAPPGTGTP